MERGKTIVILGTGGTIAGVADTASASVGYRAAQLGVQQLLQAVPDLECVANAPLQAEQIAQLDSKDMDATTWLALSQRCAALLAREDVGGVVITHGTDTVEETVWFLQCVLKPVKPVVLTCAMRPATALSADGPANLRDAVACAADAGAPGRGVLVVAHGAAWSARDVRKAHPYQLNALDGAGNGPLAWLEEGRVRWVQPHYTPLVWAVPPVNALPSAVQWPEVAMLVSHAGYTPALARALVDGLVQAGVRGLVVAGTGNGSVHSALEAALEQAQQRGMVVRITTRCERGQVVQGAGAHDARISTLPPAKARISLMLELMGWPRTDGA